MCVVSHAAASPNADPLQIWLVCFLLLIFPLPLPKSLLLLLLALTRGSLSLPLASLVDAASVNAAAIVAARVSPARLRDIFIPLPSSAPLTRRSVAFLSAKKSARTTKQQCQLQLE